MRCFIHAFHLGYPEIAISTSSDQDHNYLQFDTRSVPRVSPSLTPALSPIAEQASALGSMYFVSSPQGVAAELLLSGSDSEATYIESVDPDASNLAVWTKIAAAETGVTVRAHPMVWASNDEAYGISTERDPRLILNRRRTSSRQSTRKSNPSASRSRSRERHARRPRQSQSSSRQNSDATNPSAASSPRMVPRIARTRPTAPYQPPAFHPSIRSGRPEGVVPPASPQMVTLEASPSEFYAPMPPYDRSAAFGDIPLPYPPSASARRNPQRRISVTQGATFTQHANYSSTSLYTTMPAAAGLGFGTPYQSHSPILFDLGSVPSDPTGRIGPTFPPSRMSTGGVPLAAALDCVPSPRQSPSVIPDPEGSAPTAENMKNWNPSWEVFKLSVYRGMDCHVVNVQPGWDDEALLRALKSAYDELRAWRKWGSIKNIWYGFGLLFRVLLN